MEYLDITRPWTCTGNELARTSILGVHADPTSRGRGACLFDAALDVSRARTVSGDVKAASGAGRGGKTGPRAIGSRAGGSLEQAQRVWSGSC